MYVRLHTVDENADQSIGKSMEIRCAAFEIRTCSDGVALTAQESDLVGTGERFGRIKDYKRAMTLSMSSVELKRVVEAAIDAVRIALVLPESE